MLTSFTSGVSERSGSTHNGPRTGWLTFSCHNRNGYGRTTPGFSPVVRRRSTRQYLTRPSQSQLALKRGGAGLNPAFLSNRFRRDVRHWGLKKMKMHHFSLFAAMVLTIAVTGPPAMAQTPDGSTPAVEGICDTLKADGISKGLYGLCVAYCEAQDFSSEDEPLTDEEILALVEAGAPGGKILENYNKRRTASDPEMPCVVPKGDSCPCFTQAEVDRIDGYNDATGALLQGNVCIDRYDPTYNMNWHIRSQEGVISPRSEHALALVLLGRNAPIGLCGYTESYDPSLRRFIFGITRDEAEACRVLAISAPLCAAP